MSYDIQLACKQHEQKVISGVCVEETCDKLRPVCFNCLLELHGSHTQNVKDLDKYLMWRYEALSTHSLIVSVVNKMKDLTTTLSECLKTLDVDANIPICNLTLSQIQEQTSNLIKLKTLGSPLLQNLNYLLDNNLLDVMEKSKQYNMKPHKKQEKQQSVIKITEATVPYLEYKFSQTFKHKSITISQNGTFAEGDGFCFLESAVKNYTRIVFKIQTCGCNLWIGVSVRKADHNTNLQKLGHKSYLLHNQGYSFSDHQQHVNGIRQRFKFQDNDIIILEVDKQKISWINKINQLQYSMQIKLEGDLYPFVQLNYSKIQIINE